MKKSKEKEWKDFSFSFFGTNWKVKFIGKCKENDEMFLLGNTNHVLNEIWIATKDTNGKPLKDETIRINLIHELAHAMFSTGQYNGCTKDEPLVEWVARCINSLLEQNVFDYAK